jgi:succinate dehydrogenase / fumarate reductase, membrane anchor subunit
MRTAYRAGLWPWLLQRLSALFLIVGLGGHFLAVHFFVNKNKMLTFQEIAARMASPGWLIFDGLLLAAGLYHGLNGLNNVLRDHIPNRGAQRVIGWILFLGGAALMVFGMMVLVQIGAYATHMQRRVP